MDIYLYIWIYKTKVKNKNKKERESSCFRTKEGAGSQRELSQEPDVAVREGVGTGPGCRLELRPLCKAAQK